MTKYIDFHAIIVRWNALRRSGVTWSKDGQRLYGLLREGNKSIMETRLCVIVDNLSYKSTVMQLKKLENK